MSATHYAMALDISAHSLRRWRDLFDAEAVSIDWWCVFIRVPTRR